MPAFARELAEGVAAPRSSGLLRSVYWLPSAPLRRGERAMPIRTLLRRSHGFDHEAIRVMGIAYEFARSELRLATEDAPTKKFALKIIELVLWIWRRYQSSQ